MKKTENRPDERKLEELILYVSEKCANDPTFGSVKLNKILCYADFHFFAFYERGITNVEYQKLPNGPAPKRLVPVRNRLVRRRHLGIQEVTLRSGKVQKRPVNLRKPNLKIFIGEEIAVVDRVIEWLKEKPAGRVTDLSHELVGWLVADIGETIPYRTILFSNPPLSDDEAYRARELAAAKESGKGMKRRDGTAA